MALGSRTKQPLLHVFASPLMTYQTHDWEAFWTDFETEFQLDGQPYIEVEHCKIGKGGRTAPHVHRVYLRVRPDQRTIGLSHSYARCEKLARIAEYRTGEPLVLGGHTEAVVNALRRQGRGDVAEALINARHLERKKPAGVSPAQRAQSERLGDLAPDKLGELAWCAWRQSDCGSAFISALTSAGLKLARGDKTTMLVGPRGSAIDLRRALRAHALQAGISIRKVDVELRLADITLPSVDEIKSGGARVLEAHKMTGATHRRPSGYPLRARSKMHRPAGGALAEKKQELTQPPPTRSDRPFEAMPPSTSVPTKRALSPAQIAAIEKFTKAVCPGGVAAEVRADSKAIQEALRPSRGPHDAMADRGAGRSQEAKNPVVPALGLSRATSALAGDVDMPWFRFADLPVEMRANIRHRVDDEDGSIQHLGLQDGSVIDFEPNTLVATSPTATTTKLMVDLAKLAGWHSVEISGDAEWRDQAARLATRAGLKIASGDLAAIVRTELLEIEREDAVGRWAAARSRVVQSKTPQDARLYVEALKKLDAVGLPAGLELKARQRALSELIKLETVTAAQAARQQGPAPPVW